MTDNALAAANYLLEVADEHHSSLTQLGLMKRVYIAHGFSLALFDRPLLDPRFDRVEAWKYGPVIPSVYHSFKQFKADPITEKTVVMTWDDDSQTPRFHTPRLEDRDAREVVRMVWNRYCGMSDSDMVALTHKPGTPWALCYVKGENRLIPDEVTLWYYRSIVDRVEAKYAL
ncbi:MAG: DUF4065 domain-containing protein [Muribaculaceae bacterium]|nr:DUF4065 domain-containing protein [Muribaculaceae bacterium]